MDEGVVKVLARLLAMSRAQASLLEGLTVTIAQEYGDERERAGRSREQRLAERVRVLLAGEPGFDASLPEGGAAAGSPAAGWVLGLASGGVVSHAVSGALGVEVDYDLEGEHVGVIGRGVGCEQVLRDLAREVNRRLLCMAHGEDTVWAWLGGRYGLRMSELERALRAIPDPPGNTPPAGSGGERSSAASASSTAAPAGRERSSSSSSSSFSSSSSSSSVTFAFGEQARGLAGWRLTHWQARAAHVVALRRSQRLTRYADVALLAAALKDEMLAGTLIDVYISPLDDRAGGGGRVLRETLRAYLAAECNVASAAVALGVARNTVVNRMRTIEARLGRPLHPCPGELEVALALDELGGTSAQL